MIRASIARPVTTPTRRRAAQLAHMLSPNPPQESLSAALTYNRYFAAMNELLRGHLPPCKGYELDPEIDKPRIAAHQAPIAPQRPGGEIGRIAVIFEVEHAREADCGIFRLGPAGVGARAVRQMADTAGNRLGLDLAGRHQPENGPGRLRSGGHRGGVALARPVGCASLAPPAIGTLPGDQPVDGPSDPWRLHVLAGGIEGAQGRPGAIDIIGAPAAEPRAVRFLLGLQEIDAASDRRVA